MKYLYFLLLSITPTLLLGQIKSGPMLGYNTMKEVAVWVQMENAENYEFNYSPIAASENINSEIFSAKEENGFTRTLIAKNLEPGTSYTYRIIQADSKLVIASGEFKTQKIWKHRTDPPNFSFATGSCVYSNEAKYDRPGEPYGKGNKIFKEIDKMKPSFMLWLGDNIYLREADWTSKSGIYHRYTHFKSQAELQSFWKNTHHYAIWDDHDYGPNDADRSFINKEITLNAFQDFWANQSYGVNDKGGITNQFSYNDIDFFLLDNRYFRSPNDRKTGKREILGKKQIQWLIDALVNSRASFKIIAVGGQFLSPAAVFENHATFDKERKYLLELIEKEDLKNIIFLSGDRHKTELTKLKLENGTLLYDYTCSPLSSKAYDSHDEGNNLRVEGTHVSTQNFGLLKFNGTFFERTMTIESYNSKGELIWSKNIKKQ